MGQLTASIAHEVNQPIAAVVTNAQAALRWLNMQPPELEEIRQALDRIVRNGRRAGGPQKEGPLSARPAECLAGLCQVCVLGTRNGCVLGRNRRGVRTAIPTPFPDTVV
jgi:hypothetical protein